MHFKKLVAGIRMILKVNKVWKLIATHKKNQRPSACKLGFVLIYAQSWAILKQLKQSYAKLSTLDIFLIFWFFWLFMFLLNMLCKVLLFCIKFTCTLFVLQLWLLQFCQRFSASVLKPTIIKEILIYEQILLIL